MRRYFATLLLITGPILLCAAADEKRVPDALMNLERNRAGLRTGAVECSADSRHGTPGQDTRLFDFVTARFGLDDTVWIRKGDENGVVLRDEEGRPTLTSPISQMRSRGRVWEKSPGRGVFCQTPDAANVSPDLRTLGVMAGFSSRDLASALWKDPGSQPAARRYTEQVKDDLHIVTAETDDGVICWWIDSKRGWNPVRVTLSRNGEMWAEMRATLRQFDEVWFPEVVEHYYKGWKDGKEPKEVIRIFSAEFNRPEHSEEFSPEDIGVAPGATVILKDKMGAEVAQGLYDGEGFVTFAEHIARVKAACQTAGATGDQSNSKDVLQTRYDAAISAETEWEAYTRRFIDRYRLNPDQSEQAWRLCRSCQKMARDYIARREPQIARLKERLGQPAVSATDDGKRAQAAHEALLISVAEHVQAIFESQLKPRLEKLPTREQRKVAEQHQDTTSAGKQETNPNRKPGD